MSFVVCLKSVRRKEVREGREEKDGRKQETPRAGLEMWRLCSSDQLHLERETHLPFLGWIPMVYERLYLKVRDGEMVRCLEEGGENSEAR